MVIAFFVCMGDGLTWGSGCSGSDSPMWAFAAIAAAIAELSEGDCVLEFQHLFSAEMSPRKRQGDSTILAALPSCKLQCFLWNLVHYFKTNQKREGFGKLGPRPATLKSTGFILVVSF